MKRTLSLLCAIVMTVSMLTGIALPTLAETTDTPSAQSTERPVSYVETLVNKFDFSTAKNGVIKDGIGQDGTYTRDLVDFYSMADFVEVKAGDVVTYGPCRTTQSYQLVGLDSSGKIISRIGSDNLETAPNATTAFADDINGDIVFCTYTVPEGVVKIKATAEALYARSYLLTVNQPYTAQQWKDWVVTQNPHDTLVNLFDASKAQTGHWKTDGTINANSKWVAAEPIEMAVNDVLYMSPCDADFQDFQLIFTQTGATTGVEINNKPGGDTTEAVMSNTNLGTLKVVDKFVSYENYTGKDSAKQVTDSEDGQSIYAFRAKVAGTAYLIPKKAYADAGYVLITKNQPLTTQNYYDYWDNKADANLYNDVLDLNVGHYNANGSWSLQRNHRSSHSISVEPGDVIEMGPCYDNVNSYLVVAFDINRQNGYTENQTDANMQKIATSSVKSQTMDSSGNITTGGNGMVMRYTVPEGVYYINLILRLGQYDAFTARKVTPLTDSDNLADCTTAPYGRWTASQTSTASSWEYLAPGKIDVKAGDWVYFGPNAAPSTTTQNYYVTFWGSDGTTTGDVQLGTANNFTNPAGSLNIYDTFGSGQYIYAYRATQDGQIGFPVRTEFGDKFFATKNKPFSVSQFHTYWDSKDGANLYDWQLDYKTVMNGNGTFGTTVHHCTTHDIAVAPGQTVSFGPVQISQGYDLVLKDALGRAIGTANGVQGETISKTDLTYLPPVNATSTDYSGEPSDYAIFSYTAPADGSVRYINVVNRTWVKQFFATVYGTMTAAEYYDYIGIVPASESVIDGKKALFVGDSISAAANDSPYMKDLGRGAWAGRIAWSYQLTSTNNSVSGSTHAINTGRTYITDQLTKSKGSNFDYVIIQGGVNDANVGVQEGKISDSFNPNDFDRNTFAGALEYNISTAIELYGDTAAIGYIINYPILHRPSQSYSRYGEFVDTAKAICEKWGIQYFDMYNHAEIAEKLDLQTSASPYMQDNLHLTARGYDVVYSYIGDWMNTLTPYSTDENASESWNEITNMLITQADKLDTKYFTADSIKAFQDAAKALTSNGYERYTDTLALAGTLKQTDELIPFALYGTTLLYNGIFKHAYTFSVSTPAEMVDLASLTNSGNLNSGAVIKQTEHIDLRDNANLMIGTSTNTPFSATYDGQNYQLVGVTLNGNANGLFPILTGTIKNLVINQATMNANNTAWKGLLVYQSYGTATLENVHVIDSSYTNANGRSASLMVAEARGALTLRNCTVSGSLLSSTSTENQWNLGFMLGTTKGNAVTIENCHVFGNTFNYASSKLQTSGAFIGESYTANKVTIKNSSAFGNTYLYAGNIDGTNTVGGLIGDPTAVGVFENCFADIASEAEIAKDATVLTAAAGITANLYNGKAVEVKAGETVFLGPVDIDEATYGTFTTAAGTVDLTLVNVIPVDSFDCDQALLTYRATADGTLTANVNKDYEDIFVIAKGGENEYISCQAYYNYVDNLPGANLYISELDNDYGFFTGVGKANEANRPHRDTHTFAVKEGDVITFGPSNTNQGYHAKTFDADMNFIENIKAQLVASEGTVTAGLVFYTYTVPAGVSYMTVINYAPVQSQFVVLKNAGSLTPATYYEYLGTNTADNPLYGKSALYVGDSICFATRDNIQDEICLSWGGRIALANNMTYVNAGVSGASLSTTRTAAEGGRVITQLENNASSDFDYVVIQGGVNDAWDDAPIGTVSDSFDPTTFNEDTYAGGLEMTFYTALKNFGDQATILYLINYETPMHSLSNDSGDYFEVGRKICEKWGIPYIDLYTDEVADELMYTTKLNANTFITKVPTDYVHVSNMGYDIITPYIEEGMKTASAEAVAWEELLAVYTDAANTLSSENFTADSIAALKAQLAAVTGNNAEKLAACEAAASTLVPVANSTVAVGNIGTNFYYDYHRAAFKNYTVSTGADMVTLAEMVNAKDIGSGDTVTQLANIDMKDYPNTRIGAADDTAFAGTYDGQGYTISNVSITGTGDYVSLFPYLSGTVKNVTLENADVSGGRWVSILVGGIVGTASLIDNVHVKNSTITKLANNGLGVIACQGAADGSVVTIKNSTVSGVTITNKVGAFSNTGLILSRGRKGGTTIENCYAYNNTFIGAYTNVGGIIGECEGGTVRNSGAFNNAFAENSSATILGGLVGQGKIGAIAVIDSYTDLDSTVGSVTHGEGNATVVETNCYVSVTDLTSGELAYNLKNGTDTNWIQTATHPVVGEGEAVVKVEYVADGTPVATTYTNSNGEIITPYTEEPTKTGHLFKEWAQPTAAANGDLTINAVFVDVKDLNNDGAVDLQDVVLLLQHLVGYSVNIDLDRADISGNGKVSIYDAILLLREATK